jgi:hypothetical protein
LTAICFTDIILFAGFIIKARITCSKRDLSGGVSLFCQASVIACQSFNPHKIRDIIKKSKNLEVYDDEREEVISMWTVDCAFTDADIGRMRRRIVG